LGFPLKPTAHFEEEFQYLVDGFAFGIDWGSNSIQVENSGTCPAQPTVFEIRNIRYEK
jgi:hypothetical protein